MPVFLSIVPSSEPSSNFSQIRVEYKTIYPEKLLFRYANTSKWNSSLTELMSYFITSRYPTVSEYCGRELPVIHLQPQFSSLHMLITTVLIISLQAVPWLNQLETSCRHIGVTSANPVICEDLQLPDHSSSPVLLVWANLKRMANTTRKVIICSSPLRKGQKSWAPVRHRLDARKMLWNEWFGGSIAFLQWEIMLCMYLSEVTFDLILGKGYGLDHYSSSLKTQNSRDLFFSWQAVCWPGVQDGC